MTGLLLAVAAVVQGTPERIATIGCESCGDARELSEVSAVAVVGGLVWVATSEPPFLRAFDQRGAPVRAFGTRGGGPGELRSVGFLVAAGAELFAVDFRLRRVVQYDTTGHHRSTTPLHGFPIDVAAAASRDGPCVLISEFRPGSNRVECLGPDGQWVARGGPFQGLEVRSLAFARDGRMAIADGETEYRIRVFDRAGGSRDLRRSVERELAPTNARNSARGRALAGAEAGGRGPGPPPAGPTLRAYLNWGGLRFDDWGRLWALAGRGGAATTVFDVFNADGSFAGEVRLPGRGRTFAIGGPLVVIGGEDPEGVPTVTIWRVR